MIGCNGDIRCARIPIWAAEVADQGDLQPQHVAIRLLGLERHFKVGVGFGKRCAVKVRSSNWKVCTRAPLENDCSRLRKCRRVRCESLLKRPSEYARAGQPDHYSHEDEPKRSPRQSG